MQSVDLNEHETVGVICNAGDVVGTLRDPLDNLAKKKSETLGYFVMTPNHVHVLVIPWQPLEKLVQR